MFQSFQNIIIIISHHLCSGDSVIMSKCFNLFKTSSLSVFAATIVAQMAIKSVSISLFTISKTSFKISSSISTLGATIFTQVTRRSPAKKCFNLVGHFYNSIKQKFTITYNYFKQRRLSAVREHCILVWPDGVQGRSAWDYG